VTPIAIELRFPGGRYHATPWESHVNEGVVEWPPSPWRLLRAFIATRFLKAREEVSREALAEIIDKLSSESPCYSLPRNVVGSHTRHYMPLFVEKRKVFDTFLHLPADEPVWVVWNTHLSPAASDALVLLAQRLSYLGRAESWVEAKVMPRLEVTCNSRPISPAQPAAEGEEVVRLLAPIPAAELARWREATLDEHMTRALEEKRRKARAKGKDPDAEKITRKERDAVESGLPSSLLEALCVDTTTLRKAGWNRAPGSRYVEYARPRFAPEPTYARVAFSAHTVARFAVSGTVVPRLTNAVREAEKIRDALMAWSDGAPVFSGRDETGTILEGHQHAFILPEANGRDGRITHVTIFAPMGFDASARRALEGVRRVWQRRSPDLQLVLVGIGNPSNFAGRWGERGECPLLCSSRVWVSRTPFVPTRHVKQTKSGRPKLDGCGRIIGSSGHDAVRLLCELLAAPPWRLVIDPAEVELEPLPHTILGGKRTSWLAFATERGKGGGRRGPSSAHGFRLKLPREVQGPIALGYGAHFGLGLFEPE
jgi:CRISPR-associated protein Csb2